MKMFDLRSDFTPNVTKFGQLCKPESEGRSDCPY